MFMKQGNNMHVVGMAPRDAACRTTRNGKDVCTFSVKMSETETPDGTKSAQWQRCTIWGGNPSFGAAANICQGDTVIADGTIRHGSYEKQEGGETTRVETTDLWCDSVIVIAKNHTPPAPQPGIYDGSESVDDEDLPF